MEHVHAKRYMGMNQNIPYAKVGRQVFTSLYGAEDFCTKHELSADDWIEYGEDPDLKKEIVHIAKDQKAVVRTIIEKLDDCTADIRSRSKTISDSLQNCHPLDRGYWEERQVKNCSEHSGVIQARQIVFAILMDLERLTDWHD